jgi:hypothetical protein
MSTNMFSLPDSVSSSDEVEEESLSSESSTESDLSEPKRKMFEVLMKNNTPMRCYKM